MLIELRNLICITKIKNKQFTVAEAKVFLLNLALTEKNMQVKFNLKLSVYSLGLEIWPLFFKFNFGLMGWPQQPPRVRVPKFNKKVGFWRSISHWENRIDYFGAMVDRNIKLSKLFCEMRLLRSLRSLRLLKL